MTKIEKNQAEGSSQTIDLVIEQNIDVSKQKPLSGTSYIKLPQKLNHIKNNIKNTDNNKFFKWC